MVQRRPAKTAGPMPRRRSDGRYEVRGNFGTGPDGVRVRKSFYGDTPMAALQAYDEARRAHGLGLPGPDPNLTVGEFLKQWQEVAGERWRPNTKDANERVVRIHLDPVVGRVPLVGLTPVHVKAVVDAARKKGLAPDTVHKIHETLSTALNVATAWGYVERNVARLVPLKTPDLNPGRYLTNAQLRRLVAALRADPNVKLRYDLAVIVLAGTGLRIGELTALRWEDVDLERRVLTVRRSAVRVKGVGIVFGEPKTGKSRRTVVLPETVVRALERQRAWQDAKRFRVKRWEDNGLVFSTQQGTPLTRPQVTRAVKRALRDARLPATTRLHDLRHSNATAMRAAAVPELTMMDALGHTNQAMLRRYAQPVTDALRAAADAADALLDGLLPEDQT